MTAQLLGPPSLDQALAARTEQLRSELKDSYSSGLGLKRGAFKELGKLLTYCPPHDYTALGGWGGALNAATHVPGSALEEAALCLRLSTEATPKEFAAEKELCWDLCMALGLCRRHSALAQALAKATLSERHSPMEWQASAEALMAAGEAARATLALRVLLDEHKSNATTLLLLTKALLQTGSTVAVQDAVIMARRAVKTTRKQSLVQQARAHKALGVVLGAAAAQPGLPQAERAASQDEGLLHLRQALEIDPQDADVLYNLGVLEAEARQLPAALQHAQQALAASQGEHGPSWALLALVLSAQQELPQALAASEAGLSQAGPTYSPLLLKIKARLHLAEGDGAIALQSLAHLMARVQQAAPHTEQHTEAQQHSLRLQESDLWLELSRIFLAQQQLDDARFCVRQARNGTPWSPAAHHMAGRVLQAEGNMSAAIQSYETALAIDVHYSKAALQLGAIYLMQGAQHDLTIAKGYLVDGLRYEPHRRDGWYSLGRVHELQGRPDEAEQCLRTAVGLGLTAPVMSFSKLARLL